MKQPSASIKMLRGHRCKINPTEHKRWAAYATAALASGFSFSLADSAEAEIHYSGLINQEVPSGSCFISHHFCTFYCYSGNLTLPLRNVGVIKATHRVFVSTYGSCYTNGGSAFLAISAPGAAVRGNGFGSISRLLPGDLISAGPFSDGRILATHYGGQFSPGPGAVGFKFNTGAGDQYGWVRVRMGVDNNLRIVDYAYGDPGDVVQVGRQRSSDSAPTMESLGGLALGAAGLLAWRRRRANQRAAA